MSKAIYGVGLIAAGPVMQAIHVPTIQRLSEKFRVTHVMDVDADVARAVARRVGAASGTDADALIADPSVDVVVIGSPNRFHAEQVIASCRAGKKAVLCEKPLAISTDEAAAIAQASAEYGVPVIVGTMHAYDPAWIDALERWEQNGAAAHAVRVSAAIPPNPRSEDFATEIVGRPNAMPAAEHSREADAAAVHGGVMGLAIHDLPLVRQLVPDAPVNVHSVRMVHPWGYEITADVDGVLLHVHGVSGAPWDPEWVLEAHAAEMTLSADFSLSYVHAGSAIVRTQTANSANEYGPYPDNGYVREWEHLYDVLTGEMPVPDVSVVIDDLLFALSIADQARDMILSAEDAA